MSYQDHIKDLIDSGFVKKAAIIDSDISYVVAASDGFDLDVTEIMAIFNAIKKRGDYVDSLIINGVSYCVLTNNDGNLTGDNDTDALIIQDANGKAIVAICDPNPEKLKGCEQVTLKLADYMKETGF